MRRFKRLSRKLSFLTLLIAPVILAISHLCGILDIGVILSTVIGWTVQLFSWIFSNIVMFVGWIILAAVILFVLLAFFPGVVIVIIAAIVLLVILLIGVFASAIL